MPEPKDFLTPGAYLVPEMSSRSSTPRQRRHVTRKHVKAAPKSTKKVAAKEKVSKKVKAKSGKTFDPQRFKKMALASIASPKTPEKLKEGLRKKLKSMGLT